MGRAGLHTGRRNFTVPDHALFIFGNVVGCRPLASRLSEITAGNPLYLQEILRGIVQSGYLPRELIEKEQWPLPENVWKAVEIRLGRLKPLPRKIIETAAYLDHEFSFDQMACLLDVPEMEMLDAFDDLTCRNILIDCGPGYQFQHPLIRLALRRTTSKNRQAVIEGGTEALGRSPLCPPWGRTLGEEEVEVLLAYMGVMEQPSAEDDDDASPGRRRWQRRP